MPEIPSVSQNLLQQKYGQQKEPQAQEEFQMSAEKGVLSRSESRDQGSVRAKEAQSKKARPSAILDLSPEAKRLLNRKA